MPRLNQIFNQFDSDSGFLGEDIEDVYAAARKSLPTPEQMVTLYTRSTEEFVGQFTHAPAPVMAMGVSVAGALDMDYLAEVPVALGNSRKPISDKHVGGKLPKPKPPSTRLLPQSQRTVRDKKGSKHTKAAQVVTEDEDEDEDGEDDAEQKIQQQVDNAMDSLEKLLDETRVKEEVQEFVSDDDVYTDDEDDGPVFHSDDFNDPDGVIENFNRLMGMGRHGFSG